MFALVLESRYRGIDAGIGAEFPQVFASAFVERGQAAVVAADKQQAAGGYDGTVAGVGPLPPPDQLVVAHVQGRHDAPLLRTAGYPGAVVKHTLKIRGSDLILIDLGPVDGIGGTDIHQPGLGVIGTGRPVYRRHGFVKHRLLIIRREDPTKVDQVVITRIDIDGLRTSASPLG